MGLPQDYGFVPGRDRKVAIKLIELAEELGHDGAVIGALTKGPGGIGTGGYQAPDDVLEAYNAYLAEESNAIDSDDEEQGSEDSATGSDETPAPAPAASPDAPVSTTTDDVQTQEAQTPPSTAPGAETPSGTEVPAEPAKEAAVQPPKSGAGSGTDPWVAYAADPNRVNAAEVPWVPEDADNLNRNEIIAKYSQPDPA